MTDVLRKGRKWTQKQADPEVRQHRDIQEGSHVTTEADTGWVMCLQPRIPRTVVNLRSQIRRGKILLVDFSRSVILLTSDYRLSASRTATRDPFLHLLFKAPTSWSIFNVSPKKSIEFVSAPVWQSDAYPMTSAFRRRGKLVHHTQRRKPREG